MALALLNPKKATQNYSTSIARSTFQQWVGTGIFPASSSIGDLFPVVQNSNLLLCENAKPYQLNLRGINVGLY